MRLDTLGHFVWQTRTIPCPLFFVEQPRFLHMVRGGGWSSWNMLSTLCRLVFLWRMWDPFRSAVHLQKALQTTLFFFVTLLYQANELVQLPGLSVWVSKQLRVSGLRRSHTSGMFLKIASLRPLESKSFRVLTPVIIELIFTCCNYNPIPFPF